MDSRSQFEALFKAQGFSVARTSEPLAFANGHRRSVGDYIALETLTAWWAWNVSRQVLEVEVPSFDGYIEHISRELRAAFSDHVKAAGSKVKP